MDTGASASQQIAEYAMALDLCSELTLVLEEERVFQRILDIFSALFAPDRIILWVMQSVQVRSVLTHPESGLPLQDQPDPLWTLPKTTPTGFRMRIPYKEETIAVVEIDGLAFPDHRERYLSLALSMAGVCGLAVSNARTHSRLETALVDLQKEYAKSSELSAELKAINEEREMRVRNRTAELETAMVQLTDEIRHRTAAEEMVRNQLAEKTLLVRELHHRVKNNLQLITSMLSIQARKVPDPALKLALSESKNRIRTMSAIHENLLAAENLSQIDLPGLIHQIPSNLLALYQIPHGLVTISMTIAPVVVDINTAIPLALILNELFSNSLKHAFPAERAGEIVLEIRDERDGLLIRFADNGAGLPNGYNWENPDTVGLMLVVSLTEQLQGTIIREEGDGTRFLIRLRKGTGDSGMLRGTYNRIPE